MKHYMLFLLIVIGSVPFAGAQQQLGSISGTVTDSSGAVIAKAVVKVQNSATNLRVTARTQGNGYYLVPDLPIGAYTVTISQSGFRSESHTQVLVQADRTTTVSASLKVGTVEEVVEVKGTSLVNQTDATIGYVLNESTVNNTPLGTGSFTQLAILSPGVNADLLAGSGTNTGLGNQSIWANGQRDSSNSFSLNGVTSDNLFSGKSASQVADGRFTFNTGVRSVPGGDLQTNMSVYNSTGQGLPTPAPESIQELRVNTSMYDASQGANSGAHIELTTKSGANSFHGQVYEYRQSDAWNAAPWFRNYSPPRVSTPSGATVPLQKVPALHYNRFGGTIGGPIVKDKVFFFASYQGNRVTDSLGGNSTLTVPQHLTDDRSAAGLALVAQQDFAKTIDPATIDPAAVKLFQFKLPNGQFLIPSSNGSFQGNNVFVSAPASTFSQDQFNSNIDYNVSETDRLSARYFYSNNPTTSPFSASSLLGFTQSNQAGSYVASLNNTKILTPMLTWNQKVGITRQRSYATTTQPLTPADVGMNLFGLDRFPAIVCFKCDKALGRGVTFGPSGNLANAGFFQNQLQTSSSLIWAHGAHTVSTGFNFDAAQLNIINRNNQAATLDADDFPSLLLGKFNPSFSKFYTGATSRYYRAKQVGAYLQDNFKVTRNLNLNLGLRYDWDGPLTEKNGMLANFDASRYQYDAATDTIIDSGIVIAGNNKTIGTRGVSDSTMKGRQWGFGPRVGFAWNPSFVKNLVVRGGFGLYYDRGEFFSEFSPGAGRGFNGPFGVTLALPFVNQITTSSTSTLSNPFGTVPPAPPSNAQAITQILPNAAAIKSCNTSVSPILRCTGASTYLFGGYDMNNVLPYTENWSFDLQWQPLNSWVMTLGYVGNRGVHEVMPIPFNQAGIATPQNPIHGETSSYGFNIGAQGPNGGTLLVPSESIRTIDGGNTSLRVPYLGYSTNSVLYRTNGISSYNALQAGLQKQMSHGLQFTASYTWSHAFDEQSDLGLFFNGNNPLNPRTSYATATFDRTHVFTVAYLYRLPNFTQNQSLLGKFVNGWGLSGITVAESGQPYNIYDFSGAVGGLFYGSNVSIIDPILPLAPGVSPKSALLPGNPVVLPSNGNPNGLAVLDPSKFAIPTIAPGQNGVPLGDNMETGFSSGGRNIFRAPFQTRFDMALRKETRLTERFSLKYELDAFNVFNHVSFAAPRNNASFYNTNSINGNGPVVIGPPVTSGQITNVGSLGIIQSTIGSPRFLQMSVHLTF
jgi:hypothetical protein